MLLCPSSLAMRHERFESLSTTPTASRLGPNGRTPVDFLTWNWISPKLVSPKRPKRTHKNKFIILSEKGSNRKVN